MTANAARAFTALADPTRRLVFERLRRRPLSVGKLATGLAVTRPAVSQHLRVLKDAGLVRLERKGTHHIYSIDPRGVQAMHDYLDRFWDRALASFKTVAEDDEEDRS